MVRSCLCGSGSAGILCMLCESAALARLEIYSIYLCTAAGSLLEDQAEKNAASLRVRNR
ncbi:uncharacterized protein K489DRAFT_169999 [Dissoconium aciculare CBS 342.82]|uniref:Uncharacterized protein n=1 Tax=Dissoconium aciculare CBS 342.82 TaxID=1314786 RepID=A0A6J3M7T0_9PEZI|nr:uncharacterized protein K489DRAFT_169999 [Dissoconium aciculare CBS 342.82]KAF1823953.1 hypothetical protein K489DRAFT_169999 [Dissoconium aciculare CBS 342.82]